MHRSQSVALLAAVTLVALLGLGGTASAADPGRWVLTGASSIPSNYWQGLATSPSENDIFFIGPAQGLWQTTPQLAQTAGADKEIPTDLRHTVGYNHIGDPTWLDGEGGRVVLPMECYDPSSDPSNTCGKGAFGIADPQTLAFLYYVQLDPAFIPKAMWAETSPNGKLIWTSAGDDLIAYAARQVSQANAAPSGSQIDPVRTLPNAVPPTGVSGAVFRGRHLLIAGESNHDYEIWSVDTRTGDRTLKIEQQFCGESEGLGLISTLGGRLHWLIAPSDDSGCKLTFGPTSALLHFRHSPGHERFDVQPYRVGEGVSSGSSEIQVQVSARITRPGGAPVRGANMRFLGAHARTNRRGKATVSTTLETPGKFGVFARKGKRYGMSSLMGFNVPESAGASWR